MTFRTSVHLTGDHAPRDPNVERSHMAPFNNDRLLLTHQPAIQVNELPPTTAQRQLPYARLRRAMAGATNEQLYLCRVDAIYNTLVPHLRREDLALPAPGDGGVIDMGIMQCCWPIGWHTGVMDLFPNRCTSAARYGCLCPLHLSMEFGVAVRMSSIPGAGLGLWATRRLLIGWMIAYTGELILVQQGETDERVDASNYIVTLFNLVRMRGLDVSVAIKYTQHIDSSRTDMSVARFINDDYLHKKRNNMWIRKRRGRIVFMAKRQIENGEELLCGYGPDYWPRKIAADKKEKEDQEREKEREKSGSNKRSSSSISVTTTTTSKKVPSTSK